jgi:hypothetical protein
MEQEVKLECDKCGYQGWNSNRVGDKCPRRRDRGLCGGRLQAIEEVKDEIYHMDGR